MSGPRFKTEHILDWLDAVQARMPGNEGELAQANFDAVKSHLVRLENGLREKLEFATQRELFHALAKRFDSAVFVSAGKENDSSKEQYLVLHRGSPSSCLGIIPVGQQLLAGNMMNETYGEDPNTDDQGHPL